MERSASSSVLVLNSLYQAVQVTGVRRAFLLFYAGRARALDRDFQPYDFDNWCDLPPRAELSPAEERLRRATVTMASTRSTVTDIPVSQ